MMKLLAIQFLQYAMVLELQLVVFKSHARSITNSVLTFLIKDKVVITTKKFYLRVKL